MKRAGDIIIGAVVAILSAGIIVHVVEQRKSLWQIILGFGIYVIPFTLISSFFTKTGSFALILFTALTAYLASKFDWQDIYWGVGLAFIIGGSAFFFRVRPYRPFSRSKYKSETVGRTAS